MSQSDLTTAASRPALATRPQAIFFDLDGTLADTAADLAAPINAMRRAQNLPELPLAELRPFVSHGARGLLGKGFGVLPTDADFEPMRVEFMQRYEAALVVHTRLFDGMTEILQTIEAADLIGGVVSNKTERLVVPVLAGLGLLERSATAIGGDTTAHSKPHPAPLQHAARQVGVDPAACVYVGDDRRDIQAGHAAGMFTIAAAWGFYEAADPPQAWDAGAIADNPQDLARIIGLVTDARLRR